MSQFTVCDIRDVTKMSNKEIQEWIDSHERCLSAGTLDFNPGYVDLAQDDLRQLKNELKRRRKVLSWLT